MGNNRSHSFDSATFREFPSSASNSPGLLKSKKRIHSLDCDLRDNDPWGWFEDFESPHFLTHRSYSSSNNLSGGFESRREADFPHQPLHKALSLPPPVTEPPFYILESSLETQQLWYSTAGRRPKQPAQEREYFERLWKANFEASSVHYKEPVDLSGGTEISSNSSNINQPENHLSKKSRIKVRDTIHVSEFNGEVLYRGKAPFSHSVSKSFTDRHVSSMTIHIPSYRIFRSCSNSALRAEFLVVVSLGSPSTVTFGVWRRHSDFSNLAKSLQELNTKSGQSNVFKNALLSWDCVLQRKRWFKCLDTDYLSVKSFLLERFMHDLLFESQTPSLISSFLGLEDE